MLLTLAGELKDITELEALSTEDKLYVKAGAGCYLGESPGQVEGSWEDSLCYFVNSKGFAFPVLGGISYQTVGGFMMTGSAGGSLKHGFGDVIEEITFVDGKGKKHTCPKGAEEVVEEVVKEEAEEAVEEEDDEKNIYIFYAVGVSMGLFGVITSVTFCFDKKKNEEAFLVEGKEETVEFKDSFLKNKDALNSSLDENEYYHLNWFPQKECNLVMQWTGKQVSLGEQVIPYKHSLKNDLAAAGASLVLQCCNGLLFSSCDCRYDLIGMLLKIFLRSSSPSQTFCDYWFHALPSDNEAHVNDIMKIDFTEIWVPREKYAVVLEKLKR